jgi:hypothetical protein
MTRYIVFDDKGIIHESSSCTDAFAEFHKTKEFTGDLHLVEQLMVRR